MADPIKEMAPETIQVTLTLAEIDALHKAAVYVYNQVVTPDTEEYRDIESAIQTLEHAIEE